MPSMNVNSYARTSLETVVFKGEDERCVEQDSIALISKMNPEAEVFTLTRSSEGGDVGNTTSGCIDRWRHLALVGDAGNSTSGCIDRCPDLALIDENEACFMDGCIDTTLSRLLNPEADAFLPLSVLNVPPTPRFERNFVEFKDGIESMASVAQAIITSAEPSLQQLDRFRRLNIRLSILGKYLTSFIESAFYAESFLGEERWIRGAITEVMTLCHRYSWTTMQLMGHVRSIQRDML